MLCVNWLCVNVETSSILCQCFVLNVIKTLNISVSYKRSPPLTWGERWFHAPRVAAFSPLVNPLHWISLWLLYRFEHNFGPQHGKSPTPSLAPEMCWEGTSPHLRAKLLPEVLRFAKKFIWCFTPPALDPERLRRRTVWVVAAVQAAALTALWLFQTLSEMTILKQSLDPSPWLLQDSVVADVFNITIIKEGKNSRSSSGFPQILFCKSVSYVIPIA